MDDVEHNVQQVIHAIDLQQFSNRMAAKLSGGNKRKLSLGISLMGNPSVLLLDEPSSGMDAVAKRKIWKSIGSIASERSVLLTSHSMEEVAALASRAGIMSKRMLALGTPDELRRKNGDKYHIHLVTASSPRTSPEEMDKIRRWIARNLPDADVEENTYHGQLRFSISSNQLAAAPISVASPEGSTVGESPRKGTVATLFALLEGNKEKLGLAYYSVSQTTLDDVFLNVVRKHNIDEESAS